jgi:NAD(P)-dependent dehydrogenase (short-subunit alcohol dehydrogenase family)
VPTALEVVDGVDLTGKTCVITGASSGLGRESTRALAAAGAHVVLAARNPAALADAQAWVQEEAPDAATSSVEVDLTSLASVRSAAAAIRDLAPAVHVLMNNAGVMFTPFSRTSDGFEIQFGTNHLGHFELTRLLAPQLTAANGARIVILSSDGHRLSDVDFDDPNWERREYDKFLAYGASKTANVLHAVELDRRLRSDGVRAYAVHPGVVATALGRHMTHDDFERLNDFATTRRYVSEKTVDVRRDFLTPDRGAATQVWAAVSPELADTGGVYLADCAIRPDVAPFAVAEDRATRLWELSESLCAVEGSR